jgi:Tol biopolymer transport system component
MACGHRAASPAQPAAQAPRIAIVLAERGPSGVRLVAIDEHGDRQFELVEPVGETTRETNPSISPDGRWVVFASSRERKLGETSLWIAPLAEGAAPMRLTEGTWIDSHPAWTTDGRSIVFSSTRDGGDFDLYSQHVVDGHAVGEPVALTTAPGNEITPVPMRDGTVVYTSVGSDPTAFDSHIEKRSPDGSTSQMTEGPADAAPAVSPDERTLVFSRSVQHAAGYDAELWTMPFANARVAAPLLELPLTDESGPVWTPDGRYLFATSVLRGAEGNAVFSSVVFVDLRTRPLRARILLDRVGATARLTPAVTSVSLDASALAGNPEYLPELKRIMAGPIAKQKLEGSR